MSVPTTPATAFTNRVVTGLTGLAMLAAGALAWDWRYGWLLDLPTTVDATPVLDVVTASWFGWAAAAVGLVLALLGLWWLARNLTPPRAGTTRLPASAARGRLSVDLSSVAGAVEPRFARSAPVRDVSATTRRQRGRDLLEVTAGVDPRADGSTLRDAARALADDLATGFPDGDVPARVLLRSPRRTRRDRRTRVR